MKVGKTPKGRSVHAIDRPHPSIDEEYERLTKFYSRNGWFNIAACGTYVGKPIEDKGEGDVTCKDCLAKLNPPKTSGIEARLRTMAGFKIKVDPRVPEGEVQIVDTDTGKVLYTVKL